MTFKGRCQPHGEKRSQPLPLAEKLCAKPLRVVQATSRRQDPAVSPVVCMPTPATSAPIPSDAERKSGSASQVCPTSSSSNTDGSSEILSRRSGQHLEKSVRSCPHDQHALKRPTGSQKYKLAQHCACLSERSFKKVTAGLCHTFPDSNAQLPCAITERTPLTPTATVSD